MRITFSFSLSCSHFYFWCFCNALFNDFESELNYFECIKCERFIFFVRCIVYTLVRTHTHKCMNTKTTFSNICSFFCNCRRTKATAAATTDTTTNETKHTFALNGWIQAYGAYSFPLTHQQLNFSSLLIFFFGYLFCMLLLLYRLFLACISVAAVADVSNSNCSCRANGGLCA